MSFPVRSVDLQDDTAAREPQPALRPHVSRSPGRMSRGSPRDLCRNGSPVHEGKAGMLGRPRSVLALPGRQRGGRSPVPEAEELVRG